MKSDEVKIILEDVKEKFDVIIEGHKHLNENLDRQIQENRIEHEEFKNEILFLKKDVSDLRTDLNEHRQNTELHVVKKKKA